MTTEMFTYICDDCGSDDVCDTNASAYWDVTHQRWEYEHGNDGLYCHYCSDNGPTSKVVWDKSRFSRNPSDYEIGDTVKFEPSIKVYDFLTGNEHIPADHQHTLAIVVSSMDDGEADKRAKTYGDVRDTIIVRLITGEAIEVWPRDVYKFVAE